GSAGPHKPGGSPADRGADGRRPAVPSAAVRRPTAVARAAASAAARRPHSRRRRGGGSHQDAQGPGGHGVTAGHAAPAQAKSGGAGEMNRLRIIVGGYLGLLPAGGVTWDYVQYPAGFAALGHDTYYVEDTRLWPLYVSGDGGPADASPLVAHLARVMDDFGMG